MEEYYIGMLNLPMFSGPDDASIAISFVCFFCAYMGSGEWWQEPVEVPFGINEYFGQPSTLKRSSFAIYIVYVVEVSAILGGSIIKYWKARNESHFKQRFTVNSFILHGGYMTFNILVYDIYGLLCGSDILHTHTRSVVFCFAG